MVRHLGFVSAASGAALLLAGGTGGTVPPQPGLRLAGLGDCERVDRHGSVPPSPAFWDPEHRILRLHGARNEVLGAQLILTAAGAAVPRVDVEVSDLEGPARLGARETVTLFRELYQFVENGDWSWGPESRVLPSRRWWPDVLVPFADPYARGRRPVGAPFDVAAGTNQGVFLDLAVPRDARPGVYSGKIRVRAAGTVVREARLELTVHPFTLPDETHVDAYGEIYGQLYRQHGAACGRDPAAWKRLASRVHQLAHQHRIVVAERHGEGPVFGAGGDWDDFYGAVLDGRLFTRAAGYSGPGDGIGVAVFPAPFRQAFDGHVPDFDAAALEAYARTAREFRALARAKGWNATRFFAYVVDEAPTDARTRDNERRLQEALDAGAAPEGLPLLWTSHVNPATLAEDPARDRRGLTRWWVPNGGACDPAFLAPRIAGGERVWFYHHGHPAVGVHGVNASGVELRTWGAICWRYGLQGSFFWAVDFGDPDRPLEVPNYKKGETRWGNGVLLYPGARLPDVGLPPIDGPLPSLRMKAYRRGLQDFEYAWLLARAGRKAEADALVRRVVPVALTEATVRGEPPWSAHPEDWYRMRAELAAALRLVPAPKPGEH
ncbi:MAG: glycoside hydrolase domain-containing protein [Acidobacteriota bacterium]